MSYKPGDRVQVTDPALAEIRAIMRGSGYEPKPNHTGTVEEVWRDGETYLIHFDDGVGAPYPAHEVIPLDGEPIP